MKTCTWEQQILLMNSGELNQEQQQALAIHLAACASCRAFQQDYLKIARLTSATHERHPMPEAVKQRILSAAQSAPSRRGTLIHFPLNTLQTLTAIAALLLFCLAGLQAWRHLAPKTAIPLASQPTNDFDPAAIPILSEDAWDEEWMELEISFAMLNQEWNQNELAWQLDEEVEQFTNLLDMETSS